MTAHGPGKRMDTPYDDIPSTGEHRGGTPDTHVTSSVRAQEAPKLEEASTLPLKQAFLLSHHARERYYRVRVFKSDVTAEHDEGASEIGRFDSAAALARELEGLGGPDRYVVLENSESGEKILSDDLDVTSDWTGDGQYDQMTIFDSQEEAAAYIDRR